MTSQYITFQVWNCVSYVTETQNPRKPEADMEREQLERAEQEILLKPTDFLAMDMFIGHDLYTVVLICSVSLIQLGYLFNLLLLETSFGYLGQAHQCLQF